MRIGFAKMHGAGNDYIYLNCLSGLPVPAGELRDLAVAVSDRHTGVGSDGLILVLPAAGSEGAFGFRMFNSDGSEGEMCGNGIRCFARYVVSRGLISATRFTVETGAGLISCEVCPRGPEEPWPVTCDLGLPSLLARDVPALLEAGPDGIAREAPVRVGEDVIRVTAVSTGVPHAVVFVDDLASYPWRDTGPRLERHEAFPRKTNVDFVQVLDKGRALARVWERGAGPTQACGTGACAVAVAGALTGRLGRRAVVELPGGELAVSWREDDGHIELSGPAAEVCSGEFIYAGRQRGSHGGSSS